LAESLSQPNQESHEQADIDAQFHEIVSSIAIDREALHGVDELTPRTYHKYAGEIAIIAGEPIIIKPYGIVVGPS
jgi:hypothetical protein